MGNTTYSFADLSTVFTHPAMGQLSLQGEGVGSITFAMTDDASEHDRAADGSVMTSKIQAPNGTVAVNVQQTSAAHAWLTRLYNYLTAAPSREWAQIRCRGAGTSMRVEHIGTGLSFQKRADKPYESSGGQATWTFLAANLT